MKRCKTLLCLALALIMALSLCTVAMAEETPDAASESLVVNSIEFAFDTDDYAYGASTYVNGSVSVNKVNGEAITSTSQYSGVVALPTFADDSFAAEICVDSIAGTSSPYIAVGGGATFAASTQYYLKIRFKLQSPADDPEATPQLAAAFGSSSVSLVDKNGNAITGVDCVRYDAMQNDDCYAVYFKLPTLSVTTGRETATFKKVVELGGNAAPGKTTFALKNAIENANINVVVEGSVTVDNKGEFKGNLVFSHSDSVLLNTALNDGIYVQEVNTELPNWTYDGQVWLVKRVPLTEVGRETTDSTDAKVLAARKVTSDGSGSYTDVEGEGWCLIENMTFKNIYTKNTVTPKPSKPATTVVEAPKTFDGGVALCAALSVLSMTGAVVVGKKRDK